MHRTICDTMSDLAANAIEADAQHLTITLCESDAVYRISIEDDGRGMSPADVERALHSPYTDGSKHPIRTEGWGLLWLKQLIDQCGDELVVHSEVGGGTTVSFNLIKEKAPPLGNWCLTIAMLAAVDEVAEMTFTRENQGGRFMVTRQELITTWGDLRDPIACHAALSSLSKMEAILLEYEL